MKMSYRSIRVLLMALICCLFMTACNNKQSTDTEDETGEVIIKVLEVAQFSGQKSTLSIMADAFNKEHENIKVEIVPVSGSVKHLDELYEMINTRISVKGEIDLLYLWDSTDLWRYQERNLLEDIMPYLEKSSEYSLDKMVPGAVKCFQKNGGLYGLNPYFYIQSVGGKASQVGEKEGWTTEEFLAWLKEHPDCKGETGLSKDFVLNYFILKGSLDKYVDFEKKQAYFRGDAFQTLLQELKEMPLDEQWYVDTWYESASSDYIRLEWINMHDLATFADLLSNYGEDLILKGFPTADGVPRHYISSPSLSMLVHCKHKEEAYQFIEYVQLHFPEICGGGNELWMDRDLLEQSFASLNENLETLAKIRGREAYVLTDHQEQILRNAIDAMVVESLEQRIVWDIIEEEVLAYFNDDKSVDEVCDIIQKRVQLFLSENELGGQP